MSQNKVIKCMNYQNCKVWIVAEIDMILTPLSEIKFYCSDKCEQQFNKDSLNKFLKQVELDSLNKFLSKLEKEEETKENKMDEKEIENIINDF